MSGGRGRVRQRYFPFGVNGCFLGFVVRYAQVR